MSITKMYIYFIENIEKFYIIVTNLFAIFLRLNITKIFFTITIMLVFSLVHLNFQKSQETNLYFT